MEAKSRLIAAVEAEDAGLVAVAYDAILYDLVIIGEAVKALPTEVTSRRDDIEWKLVARLRDRLAHHYHRVDALVIAATIDASLPSLREACAGLIESGG